VLVWWTLQLWEDPAEAFHFVQYGVLGCLLFLALRPSRPDLSAHLAAALAGVLLGTVDELIQWLTPERFWDFRDLVLNGAAACLVQPALWRLDPPTRRLSWSAIRLPLRLVALELMLLLACLAATPARIERLADRWPALAFLGRTSNVMVEYGSRYRLAGVGSFQSRLELGELDREDLGRAEESAAFLDRYPPGRYGRFLEEVSPARDPFVYELRVHVFARDANLGEALKLPEGSAGRIRRMTTALREQQVLETVFGATLERSSFQLSAARRAQLEAEADPELEFDSRVARHLITWISEPRLRMLVVVLLLFVVVLDLVLGRRSRRRHSPEGRFT